MEPKEETIVEVNDEATLDAELEETLSSIKAGNEPQAIPEVKTEESSEPPTVDDEQKAEYEFRIPNKGKFESDESYEKRIELMDLVKRRKLAKTDEQRQQISDDIKTTKGQLKNLNGSDKIINPLNQSVVEQEEEIDEFAKADIERLRELGGATKEDIKAILQEERFTADVAATVKNFVERTKELNDEDVREVFFDFVENNYNYQGKSGKDLMTVLALAHESMFKPSESIQERVLKGADVQSKINAMQFPGGTITKTAISPELRKDLDEMMATGMSEAKALELLSD